MTCELPKFKRIQQTFANHIKSPAQVDCPSDIDERSMAIYRDLFFKNIMGFLSGGFPVLAEIIGEERWHIIGRKFFSHHHNKTPYFLEISREFLSFLEHEYTSTAEDPVYLYELAHYEWLELYVDVEPEGAAIECDNDGDILSNVPVMSPVVEGFLYQHPVHQISAENSSPDPKPSALIVYRARDDEVGFAETNPFTLQLLALLKEGGRTGEETLSLLMSQNGLAGQQAAYDGGVQTLQLWQRLGIIWGCCL
jgi:hypothetical protein|tara:strand:+ start:9465 stop:10220 length:756 start_codon:yes stop_codon:yes gene_type:complete